MPDNECLECRIVSGDFKTPGGVLLEGPNWMVVHYHPRKGIYPGRLMAVLKRHAKSLSDLTDAEAQSMAMVARRMTRSLDAGLAPERMYMLSFNEDEHVHFHILSRFKDDAIRGPNLVVQKMLVDEIGGQAEAEAMAAKLKPLLQDPQTGAGRQQ